MAGKRRGGVGLAQENAPPPPAHAAFPPPVGQEASYQWYLGQYTDPTMFTPVGLPADPAETAVSPHGALLYANCQGRNERGPLGRRERELVGGVIGQVALKLKF